MFASISGGHGPASAAASASATADGAESCSSAAAVGASIAEPSGPDFAEPAGPDTVLPAADLPQHAAHSCASRAAPADGSGAACATCLIMRTFEIGARV